MRQTAGRTLWKLAAVLAVTIVVLILGKTEAKAEVLPADVSEASEGCIFLGAEGSYLTEAQNALDRINEIRWEACTEGVPDPGNASRNLTEADYVPIKWSTDLERVARLRAAENSISMFVVGGGHYRLNGKNVWSVSYNGISGESEDLAFNFSSDMLYGIEQWYEEKEDWVNRNSNAVTGHYTSMIDPDYQYIGIGAFYNWDFYYPNTVCARLSARSGLGETPLEGAEGIVQTLETRLEYINSLRLTDITALTAGETLQMQPEATLTGSGASFTLTVLSNLSYSSSNTGILTVSDEGLVTAVSKGTATITASYNGSELGSHTITVNNRNLAEADAFIGQESFFYTGSAFTPEVTVSYHGERLKEKTDFTVSYINNIDAGTAAAVLTGKGSYDGTLEVPFSIDPYPLDSASITLSAESYECDGTEKRPSVTVRLDSRELVEGTDYTVTYKNNTLPGTATVVVTGINNYTGSVSETFEITHNAPHTFGEWVTVTEASCTAAGEQKRTCLYCDESETQPIDATGHHYSDTFTVDKKATPDTAGQKSRHCTGCSAKTDSTAIAGPKTVTLSKTKYVYSGTANKPSVTVRDSSGAIIADSNYKVSYSNNKNPGTATVTVTFKGKTYEGVLKKTFTIKPKGTSLKSLTAGSKSFTAKWTKQSAQTDGYEIQYSTSEKFKSGTKTETIASAKKTSATIKKLKAKKTYYVRIRTYKTVNGKKLVSAWSDSKKVKTKA